MAVASTRVAVATVAPVDEIQVLDLSGASAGVITVSYDGGLASGSINFDDDAAAIQSVLLAMSEFDTGDIVVSGSGGVFDLAFGGAYAGQAVALLVADDAGLTGTVSITQSVAGAPRAPVRLDSVTNAEIIVRNVGSQTVLLGGASVDPANGFPLEPGSPAVHLGASGAIYGVTEDGGSSAVVVLEVGA